MAYVDGFVLSVPKDKVDDYLRIARETGAIWKEHGALSVVECVADDTPVGEATSFPRAVQATEDEVVVFGWMTYPSREARDATNTAVMADPRMGPLFEEAPFDGKRMIYGGFTLASEL